MIIKFFSSLIEFILWTQNQFTLDDRYKRKVFCEFKSESWLTFKLFRLVRMDKFVKQFGIRIEYIKSW